MVDRIRRFWEVLYVRLAVRKYRVTGYYRLSYQFVILKIVRGVELLVPISIRFSYRSRLL